METSVYFLCFIGGLLGILFHVVVLKLPTLKKRSESAGINFSIANYIYSDWLALLTSVLTLLICIFILDEIIKLKPWVMEYVKFFFVFIGYTGSSILQTVFGKTDKMINKIINDSPNVNAQTQNFSIGGGQVPPNKDEK